MESEKVIIESLSPIERKILPNLALEFENSIQIIKKSNIDSTTVFRALEFLKAKNLVELEIKIKKIVSAGVNGIYYQKKSLPERKLLNELREKRFIPFNEVGKACSLNDDEAKAAIGVLKKKAFIEISSGRIILKADKRESEEKMPEEKLLEKLPKELDELKPEEKLTLKNLESRKNIIQIDDKKEIFVKLTQFGNKIAKMNLDENLIEQLTPNMIKTSSWKGKKFRRYDLLSPVSKVNGGKRHFVNQATEYAKKIWLDMGFKEMTGDLVVTGFWNFDALFQPQDHPARELADTFFIKNVEGNLPNDKKLIESVKKSHEGEIDNSKGWQYNWEEKDAKKVLLRTHTTCISSRTLKKIQEKKEFPAKYFALGKCFRNETVDWSHGFEFNQTEGIVVDENANFRQLLGYLNEFFKKMGYEKLRIRPGYFPYTEPSLEIDVWHPGRKKWLELGGAGMFRPEVTIPFFGKHVPVLAWGPGFDRIIMEFFAITDLRDMYRNNITQLRTKKFWRK
ncbi:MAG: phenylalanine--tRNA ligase subunit alpha [Nanoarchaeota archaeon]